MTLLRVRTRVAILLGVTGAGLAFAGSAFAHANVSPAVVLAKNAQVFALAVPTEKENAFTTTGRADPPERLLDRLLRTGAGLEASGADDRHRGGDRRPEGHLDRREGPDR